MTTEGTSTVDNATLLAGPAILTVANSVPEGLNSCPSVCVTMFAGRSLVPHSADALSMASIEAL